MLAIVPLSSFLLLFLVLRKLQVLGWRGSFLLAAIIWGFLLAVMTEFLSRLKWLDLWPLLGAWCILLILLIFILIFSIRNKIGGSLNLQTLSIPRFERALLACVIILIVTIGITAWVAPPNTWDSMTYHMSRVIHWMQNKSVAFYSTHILRQLYMNPWSEYAILHFQILNGNDSFANFIQWFSMVGSIIGVSLLAKELNASIRGQVIAAVICATLPMGILQGSSTQTDYVVSFWLVCFIYFSMLLRKEAKILFAFGTGAALGLGVLTKPTMYIFALPFLLWLVVSIIKTRNKHHILYIGLALIIAFLLNIHHYVRNYDLFTNPINPGQAGPDGILSNETYTFPAISSNIIRNVGLHLGTPSLRINYGLEKSILLFHKLVGISPNDERTTWGGTKFHIQYSSYEDSSGNLIHLLLITMSLLIYIFRGPKKRDTNLFIISLILAILIFSVYLKWQPWNSRFHLPLFVLFATFVGLIFSHIRTTTVINLAMILLILVSLPWVLHNSSRPLFGNGSIFRKNRTELYFTNNPSMSIPFQKAAQFFHEMNCASIGLVINNDDWEYPLWVLLHDNTSGSMRLEHINVTNISRRLYANDYPSKSNICAIFSLAADPSNIVTIENNVFLREWSSNSVNLYRRISIP